MVHFKVLRNAKVYCLHFYRTPSCFMMILDCLTSSPGRPSSNPGHVKAKTLKLISTDVPLACNIFGILWNDGAIR